MTSCDSHPWSFENRSGYKEFFQGWALCRAVWSISTTKGIRHEYNQNRENEPRPSYLDVQLIAVHLSIIASLSMPCFADRIREAQRYILNILRDVSSLLKDIANAHVVIGRIDSELVRQVLSKGVAILNVDCECSIARVTFSAIRNDK
jgi:hypothetical protein